MSYCRFSSDDYGCDLYCYEAGDGLWITHVAGNRVVGVPKLDWKLLEGGDPEKLETFAKQHTDQMSYLNSAERVDIDLPFAGETFEDGELSTFYSRLCYLREVGYNFPDAVLERVKSEIEEVNS